MRWTFVIDAVFLFLFSFAFFFFGFIAGVHFVGRWASFFFFARKSADVLFFFSWSIIPLVVVRGRRCSLSSGFVAASLTSSVASLLSGRPLTQFKEKKSAFLFWLSYSVFRFSFKMTSVACISVLLALFSSLVFLSPSLLSGVSNEGKYAARGVVYSGAWVWPTPATRNATPSARVTGTR